MIEVAVVVVVDSAMENHRVWMDSDSDSHDVTAFWLECEQNQPDYNSDHSSRVDNATRTVCFNTGTKLTTRSTRYFH